MNFLNAILLLLAISLSTGCGIFEVKNSNPEIARVGEDYLYQSDIDEITYDLKVEDSAEIARNYIDSWIKEKLLLQKALQNLSESQTDFEKQLENYRKSLLIYAYENQIIKQKLDTSVSAAQVLSYYNQNKANFKLKQDILIARFIKCLNSAPHQDSIKTWFNQESDFLVEKLTEYCAQFALRCDLDTSNWVSQNSLLAFFPSQANLEELSFSKNILQKYSDSTETVYFQVLDFRASGKYAPVSFVRNQIEEIVRNKRRLELLTRVREEIFEEATLKRKYEIYTKN